MILRRLGASALESLGYYVSFNFSGEKTGQAWLFRLLVGPAGILDGIISTLSIGSIQTDFQLHVMFHLGDAREYHQRVLELSMQDRPEPKGPAN